MENGASSYRRFLDGDKSGLGEIIKEYRDGLMLYINRYTRNIHISEELAEETFVRLVVKRPRFSEKSGFKAFLYSIGRHIALDYLRKCPKDTVLSVEQDAVILKDEADLERDYIKNEQKITLHKALDKINSDYAKVLYLMYFEDFDAEQTACIINKSKKQTYNMIHRAKAALKQQLEKEGFVYEEL